MILKCVGGPLDGRLVSDDVFDWTPEQRDCIISISHPGTIPVGYVSSFQGVDDDGFLWTYQNKDRKEFIGTSRPKPNYSRILRERFHG